MKKIYSLLLIVLFFSCKNEQNEKYSRESEILAFCKALNISTKEQIKVLYIPYSRCSACQMSSKSIFSDTTSLIYVIHFNEWQGKIDNERFVYKKFGDFHPIDFGIITPYPILFTFYEDKILDFEAILK